jgi:hypothetical protein
MLSNMKQREYMRLFFSLCSFLHKIFYFTWVFFTEIGVKGSTLDILLQSIIIVVILV